jgi:hypothetical protein
MRSRSSALIVTLILVNVVLLLTFLDRVGQENMAQAQAVQRRPGDFLMIPMQTGTGTAGIVVVLDATNHELSAVAFDEAQRRISAMPRIDLNQVFAAGAAAQPQTGTRRTR